MPASGTDPSPDTADKLTEIFAQINMSELPAMSGNVQELISLTYSGRSAAYDLSKVILKDYSLTNKVLQVVNSAFYSLGWPVNSISKAVTVLGFDAVRDLATVIALFEDFIKSGADKEEISKLLTRSFLSGLQARQLAVQNKIKVAPEEVFICTLLHSLGKIIVCIYLPDVYREIEQKTAGGVAEETAERQVLNDLTYRQIGEEIARFWNLSDHVVVAMDTDPLQPRNGQDATGYLQNLAAFTNRLVDQVCRGEDINPLLGKYGEIVSLDREGAIKMLDEVVEQSEDLSNSIRYGLSKLKIRSKLRQVQQADPAQPATESAIPTPPGSSDEEALEMTALPISPEKSVNDFIRDLTETLMGSFKINDFYVNLLEGLYRGVGFDRIVFAIVSIKGSETFLVGRFGLGDIDPENVKSFQIDLSDTEQAIPRSLETGRDMAIPPNAPKAFPNGLQSFVADRMVYLFPVRLDGKPIGMLYLDRKQGRPRLDEGAIKTTRLFRDFAVMALRKLRKK